MFDIIRASLWKFCSLITGLKVIFDCFQPPFNPAANLRWSAPASPCSSSTKSWSHSSKFDPPPYPLAEPILMQILFLRRVLLNNINNHLAIINQSTNFIFITMRPFRKPSINLILVRSLMFYQYRESYFLMIILFETLGNGVFYNKCQVLICLDPAFDEDEANKHGYQVGTYYR